MILICGDLSILISHLPNVPLLLLMCVCEDHQQIQRLQQPATTQSNELYA